MDPSQQIIKTSNHIELQIEQEKHITIGWGGALPERFQLVSAYYGSLSDD